MYYGNAGYIGQRMSVRAYEAYECGEAPLSKWGGSDLDLLQDLLAQFGIEPIANLKVWQLKMFIKDYGQSSYHHTGKYYSKTAFYSLWYAITDGACTEYSYVESNDISLERLNILREYANRKRLTLSKQADEVELDNLEFVTLHYFTWGGTRNHPKPYDTQEEAVRIKDTSWFYLLSGSKKNIDTNGVYIEEKHSTMPDCWKNEDGSLHDIVKKLLK